MTVKFDLSQLSKWSHNFTLSEEQQLQVVQHVGNHTDSLSSGALDKFIDTTLLCTCVLWVKHKVN